MTHAVPVTAARTAPLPHRYANVFISPGDILADEPPPVRQPAPAPAPPPASGTPGGNAPRPMPPPPPERLPVPPEAPRPAPHPLPPLVPHKKNHWHHKSVHWVRFRPRSVRIPAEFHENFRSAMKKDKLVLKKVLGIHLKRLPKADLKRFLDALSQQTVKAHWHRGAEEAPPHYHFFHLFHRANRSKVTAGAALALIMMQKGHPEQAQRIVKARPVDVAKGIGAKAPSLFPVDTLEAVIRRLVPQITHRDNSYSKAYELAAAAGTMVHAFLDEHAEDSEASIENALIHLLVRLENSGFKTTTPNLGALAGVIFAGGLKHTKAIREKDEDRFKIINNVVLLVFAASSMIPVATTVTGAIATAAVLTGIALQKVYKIRDLSEFINELEGKLRLGLLKQEVFTSEYEFTNLMGWVDTIILCNGMR